MTPAPDDKDARIARLVALEAKATRAPWNSGGIRPTTVEKGTIHVDVDQPYEKYVVRAIYPTPQGRCTQFLAEMLTTARHEEETPANAALIAAVRNELPWLLDQARAVARLKRENAALREGLRKIVGSFSCEAPHDQAMGFRLETGGNGRFTAGDLRRAARLLAPTTSTERTDAPSPEHRDETGVGHG